jgi:hypothetical protein
MNMTLPTFLGTQEYLTETEYVDITDAKIVYKHITALIYIGLN